MFTDKKEEEELMDLSEWCDFCKIRYNESAIDHEASNQHQRAFDEAYKKLLKKEKEDKKPGMSGGAFGSLSPLRGARIFSHYSLLFFILCNNKM